MKKMAELCAGALVTFLQEMVVDDNTLTEDKPVLLQIRSIIPVLREGDHLWPNQGFFLRVSDLSHAIYVSLPQEEDEMVLYDKLHIGQFLYVENLEAAYPVPLLKGIRPLPGRHPCHGNPKDLIPLNVLEKFLGVPKLDSTNEEQKDPPSVPESKEISIEEVDTKNNPVMKEKELRENTPYVSASGISSNEASSDEMKEQSNDVTKAKQSEKPPLIPGLGRSKSLTEDSSNEKITKTQSEKTRPFGTSRGSLNEKTSRRASIHRPRKTDVESTLNYRHRRSDARKFKPRHAKDSDIKSSISISTSSSSLSMFKRKSWSSKEATKMVDITETPIVKHEVNPDGSSPSVSISQANIPRNDSSDDNWGTTTKQTVTSISIKSSKTPRKNSNPISQKVSEDSINEEESCSSIHDQISAEINISWDCLPSSLVKLGQEVLRQRDIAFLAAMEALLEASSAEILLKCLSIYSEVLSAKEAEEYHPSVDKFFDLEHDLTQNKLIFQPLTSISPLTEATQLAIDRKQNAVEWIKAALESNLNLNPVSDMIKTRTIPMNNSSESKIPKKKRSKIRWQADIEKGQIWVKGSALSISAELANSLHNESNAWFLKYVEDYLDWVRRKINSSESDNQVPEMMFRIKKVSDWLDMRCKDKSMEESEMEACRKVRSKIYGILLTHVERTARNAIAQS